MKKLAAVLPVWLLLMFVCTGMASAHVTVHPSEVTEGSYETFTVNVPSEEEDTPTVRVKVAIPKGVVISRVMPVQGWRYDMEKDDTGKVTSITWQATGDGLSPTEFTQFKMSGKVNENVNELTFKAYQTYGDGTVVKWVGAEGSETPASVTNVTATEGDGNRENGLSKAPLYLSVISLILAIIAVAVALRKKST